MKENATEYPNTRINYSGDLVTSSAGVMDFIYESVKRSYSANTLVLESFDVLRSEMYYEDMIPSLKGLVFSDPKIYVNAVTVRCSYSYTDASLTGEERAVEYAIVNETTERLTDSERELYDKVIEVAESLIVYQNGNNTSGSQIGDVQGSSDESVIDEYQTVKNIHDYLVRNIVYTYSSQMGGASDQTVRSALFLNKCVCAGYAKSFYFLCKACGLDVLYISGTAINSSGSSESHAWNKVMIDGKWYAIDVTWDDPLPDKGDVVQYYYFLITDEDIDIDHNWDDDSFPDAVSTDLGLIYEQFGDVEKFSTDAAAYQYILDKLEESKVLKAPSQSGFDFELTVISSDGSSLYNQIKQLCTDYHNTYGCGYSSGYSSAGFYGYEYHLSIYH